MATAAARHRQGESPGGALLAGLGRALGGALLFGMPMLMTMELWELGATLDRFRLALLVALAVPLLVGVSHRVGFEPTFGWREDLRDAAIALGVGLLSGTAVLSALAVLGPGMSAREMIGAVAIQAVPAAFGAILGRSQFGGAGDDEEPDGADGDDSDDDGAAEPAAFDGYPGTLFMMIVGALYFSLNIAPTEEMVLISFKMTPWHGVVLILASLALMHGFVYGLGFHGGAGPEEGAGWSSFLRVTLVGYVLCLSISLFCLWIFGSLRGMGSEAVTMGVIVLAFPAALGAATARLVL